jgi:hypothetical protein
MKAEISGTMVMYIMSAVVIMMVIGYGINQMLNLQGDLSKINCLNFRKQLKERIIKDRPLGTIDSKGIVVNCDTPRICFIDLDAESSDMTIDNKIISSSWGKGVRKNVFLLDEDMVFPMGSFYVKGLKPIGEDEQGNTIHYLCVDVKSGFLDVLLQGRGRYVVIKKNE